MIYLAGIIITFFLTILLTGKKNKTPADRILIVWLCAIGFHLLQFYLSIADKIFDYPYLLGIHLPYPLIHGPFLFLYTAELTRQQPKNKFVGLLHFLPLIILYLYLIPFFSLPASEKINVYRNQGAGYEGLMKVCSIVINISGVAYTVASLFLLRRYRKSIEDEFSNTEKINLAWLRYLIYGTAGIWICVIIGTEAVIFGSVVLFVFLLGYFGIRQVGIFTSPPFDINKLSASAKKETLKEPDITNTVIKSPADLVPQLEIINFTQKTKYEKSGLSEEQAENIHKQLVGCMTNKKLFTEFELTLVTLAKTLDVHPNHLSQVINSYEGKNFYDYINFHRVEEFKKLASLPANRNYTLLSLAYECGFNSKTSFNRNFKKTTGLSPTEWLHQQNISLKLVS